MFLRNKNRIILIVFFFLCLSSSIYSYSTQGLDRKQKDFLSYYRKIGASKAELDTISVLLKSNAPQKEIQKRIDLITQRKLSQLPLEQQRIYYSLGDNEKPAYLSSSDKDKWVRKRDFKSIKKLCGTREGKIQYYALANLLSKMELTDFIRCDSADREAWLKRYWAFKDPTSTTIKNEWEEEFNRRVEFSLLNCHSNFGQKPWDDRGDVYIKLGPPEQRELSADSAWKTKVERTRGPVTDTEQEFYKTACETWNYVIRGKDIFFQFEDMKFVGYFSLVPYKSSNPIQNLDYLSNFQVEKSKVEIARAEYHHDYGGKPLDFAWEIIKFRSIGDVYEVLINIGIPTDKLTRDSVGLISYTQEIAIRDERGNMIRRDSIKVSQKVPEVRNELLVDQKQLLLPRGIYQVALEVRDLESKRIGLYKEEIFLPGYVARDSLTRPALEVSRAILSSVVKEAESDKPESKFFLNGYLIVPNPGHIFLDEQESEIQAYFEIYNLQPRNDTVRFATVSHIIKYLNPDQDTALVNSDTTVITHQGFIPGMITYQIINLVGRSGVYLEPGDYLWRIDVIDLNAPNKTESIINKLRIIKGQNREVLSRND